MLWQRGTPLDLNELIPPNSGWELRVAAEINGAGQIAGFGTIGGRQHAYLLTPLAPGGLPRTGAGPAGGSGAERDR